MKIFKAVNTALRNPGMPLAYSEWLKTKLLKKQGPFLEVGFGARIGQNWNGFSEYWSFRGAGADPAPAITAPIDELISATLRNANGPSIAVDIGANVGAFAVALATAGFSEVHAFEPIPATFNRLSDNVALNNLGSRIKLNQLGIGDVDCSALMHYDPKSPATAAVVNAPAQNVHQVKITTLDRYAVAHDIRQIDFLKIDTEGFESAVLRGAESLLRSRSVKTILLEWCPELLNRTGSSPDELWQTIINLGYRLCRITGTRELDCSVSLGDLRRVSWENVVALPRKDSQ